MRTFGKYIAYYENLLLDEGHMGKFIATGLLGATIGTPIGFKAADKMQQNRYERRPKTTNVSNFDVIKTLNRSRNRGIFMQPKTQEEKPEVIEKPEVTDSTLEFIKSWEKFDSKAYNDGFGNLTIGYGFTRYIFPDLKKGDTITREEADEKLFNILKNKYERFIHDSVKVPISQEQFDALISWAYNVGKSAAGRSTLLSNLNNQNYMDAASEFIRWNKVAGQPALGLTRRREKEKSLFIAGLEKIKDLYENA